MADDEQPLAVKVGTVLLTVAAGWAAQKLVGVVWEKTTGSLAPTNVDDDELSIIQAVTFAAVSGGVAVLAKRLARQGAVRAGARFRA
ncbi:DUF4235 domain-containing protein [Isoptericola sp. NEAU-Y5]|uniref:DUF4235 domain-containing protein n=1 Tax=Isoptericola luteus TaxID=2879484 RepID=A0ABS7ZGV7_9MICO|nr:DUF4235 domain-containing protein [Isoptericola sp. NEAU-Y5]MCA5894250.1 DUF4235 domain-containing protein [Isoptericola sp. NEAU-Y5]